MLYLLQTKIQNVPLVSKISVWNLLLKKFARNPEILQWKSANRVKLVVRVWADQTGGGGWGPSMY